MVNFKNSNSSESDNDDNEKLSEANQIMSPKNDISFQKNMLHAASMSARKDFLNKMLEKSDRVKNLTSVKTANKETSINSSQPFQLKSILKGSSQQKSGARTNKDNNSTDESDGNDQDFNFTPKFASTQIEVQTSIMNKPHIKMNTSSKISSSSDSDDNLKKQGNAIDNLTENKPKTNTTISSDSDIFDSGNESEKVNKEIHKEKNKESYNKTSFKGVLGNTLFDIKNKSKEDSESSADERRANVKKHKSQEKYNEIANRQKKHNANTDSDSEDYEKRKLERLTKNSEIKKKPEKRHGKNKKKEEISDSDSDSSNQERSLIYLKIRNKHHEDLNLDHQAKEAKNLSTQRNRRNLRVNNDISSSDSESDSKTKKMVLETRRNIQKNKAASSSDTKLDSNLSQAKKRTLITKEKSNNSDSDSELNNESTLQINNTKILKIEKRRRDSSSSNSSSDDGRAVSKTIPPLKKMEIENGIEGSYRNKANITNSQHHNFYSQSKYLNVDKYQKSGKRELPKHRQSSDSDSESDDEVQNNYLPKKTDSKNKEDIQRRSKINKHRAVIKESHSDNNKSSSDWDDDGDNEKLITKIESKYRKNKEEADSDSDSIENQEKHIKHMNPKHNSNLSESESDLEYKKDLTNKTKRNDKEQHNNLEIGTKKKFIDKTEKTSKDQLGKQKIDMKELISRKNNLKYFRNKSDERDCSSNSESSENQRKLKRGSKENKNGKYISKLESSQSKIEIGKSKANAQSPSPSQYRKKSNSNIDDNQKAIDQKILKNNIFNSVSNEFVDRGSYSRKQLNKISRRDNSSSENESKLNVKTKFKRKHSDSESRSSDSENEDREGAKYVKKSISKNGNSDSEFEKDESSKNQKVYNNFELKKKNAQASISSSEESNDSSNERYSKNNSFKRNSSLAKKRSRKSDTSEDDASSENQQRKSKSKIKVRHQTPSQKMLFEFEEEDKDLKELDVVDEDNFPHISSEDEVFMLRVPKDLDVDLSGTKINLTSATKIKSSKDNSLVCVPSQTTNENYVSILLHKDGEFNIKTLKLSGKLMIHQELKTTKTLDLDNSENPNVVFPDNLKPRHPLFGTDYSERISLDENIKYKLQEAVQPVSSKSKKHKNKIKAFEGSNRNVNENEVIFKFLKDSSHDSKNENNISNRKRKQKSIDSNLDILEYLKNTFNEGDEYVDKGKKKKKRSKDLEEGPRGVKNIEERNNFSEVLSDVSRRKRKRSKDMSDSEINENMCTKKKKSKKSREMNDEFSENTSILNDSQLYKEHKKSKR